MITTAKPLNARKYKFGVFLPRTAPEWTYSYAVAFSAGTVFLARFLQDGPPVAFGFLVFAAFGFFFRWRKMPILGVVTLAYFLFAPLLVPLGSPAAFMYRTTHFEPMTIVLVVAVIAYLSAQYRLYGLIERAMPPELRAADNKLPDPHCRSVEAIATPKLVRMVVVAAIAVVLGEAAYLLVTELYFEPTELPLPIRWAGGIGAEWSKRPGAVEPWLSRLILTAFGLVAIVGVARFAFWYWRLNRLTPEEGTATLIDDAWVEQHGDLRKIEFWRAWAARRRPRRTGR
jgi:hypothetical protein